MFHRYHIFKSIGFAAYNSAPLGVIFSTSCVVHRYIIIYSYQCIIGHSNFNCKTYNEFCSQDI